MKQEPLDKSTTTLAEDGQTVDVVLAEIENEVPSFEITVTLGDEVITERHTLMPVDGTMGELTDAQARVDDVRAKLVLKVQRIAAARAALRAVE